MSNLRLSFEQLEGHGMGKIASMIRLALKEAPRLQEALSSLDSKKRENGRLEAAFALEAIDLELLKLESESGQKQDVIWNKLLGEGFFTPQELKAIDHYFQFIQTNRHSLFEKSPSAKNTQPTRSKKLRFKA